MAPAHIVGATGTLEFPLVDLPRWIEPRAYLKLKEDDLERIAETARRHWKLGESPINNIVLLVENVGAVVSSLEG